MALRKSALISARFLRRSVTPLTSGRCCYESLSIKTPHLLPKQQSLLKLNSTYIVSYRKFSDWPPHVVLKLPSLSPTMETGTVVSWAKNEGDQVSDGDLLAEIETDKATMSMDASDEGYVAKILHPAGTKNIPVGDPLVIIVESVDLISKFADYKPEASGSVAVPAATPPAPKPDVAAPVAAVKAAVTPMTAAPMKTPSTPNAGGRVFISPLARRVALERGIDINSLSGSGSGVNGCFALTDLDHIVSTPLPTSGAYTDLPISGMRAVIAKRLVESKQTIPHYYLTVDIEIDELLKLRKDLNATIAKLSKGEDKQAKISVNDIFIKAMAHANKCVPECNSAWMGDCIRQYDAVDVCVAVATPAGLITPIVFGADSKGLLTISQEVRSLAQKAKENKLKPEEFQGGSITISNLGMYGISSFSAIINPPQACILAVGGAQKRIVPHESEGHKQATYVSVTLCCDHRVVDGAVGAQWLSEFKSLLECPARMLM